MLLQGRDHLALILDAEDQTELLAAWEAAPRRIGDPRWDTLLATVVQHEFKLAGLASPSWAAQCDLLSEPWTPEHPFLSHERIEAMTPQWLREANIFVPQRDLITA